MSSCMRRWQRCFETFKFHSSWFNVCSSWKCDVSGHGFTVNALNNIYDDDNKTLRRKKKDTQSDTLMKNELEKCFERIHRDTSFGIKQCGTVKNVEPSFTLFLSFLLRLKATDCYNKCTHQFDKLFCMYSRLILIQFGKFVRFFSLSLHISPSHSLSPSVSLFLCMSCLVLNKVELSKY